MYILYTYMDANNALRRSQREAKGGDAASQGMSIRGLPTKHCVYSSDLRARRKKH
jgi:hypothetical protein